MNCIKQRFCAARVVELILELLCKTYMVGSTGATCSGRVQANIVKPCFTMQEAQDEAKWRIVRSEPHNTAGSTGMQTSCPRKRPCMSAVDWGIGKRRRRTADGMRRVLMHGLLEQFR